MSTVAMRVARPTVDLDRIRSFYEHVVGLPLLWSFADHDGFDGAIFGLPDERAQLELVRSLHGDAPAPTSEDALVLYFGDGGAGAELVDRLRRAGTIEVTAVSARLNPYCRRRRVRGSWARRSTSSVALFRTMPPATDRRIGSLCWPAHTVRSATVGGIRDARMPPSGQRTHRSGWPRRCRPTTPRLVSRWPRVMSSLRAW
jgi:hypothetical protein